ncbi:hypothetical protein J5N97_017433 [Dioscorea zingiberensis]|uniref:WRKY domain-containing protein n=1 Tax=Dioscorea zingiberensis TaxID=325984 RepID=A0A9D5HGJ1_9LILI|nr:hypothetical protein J5N97_017433 [Dioscorea zingiberensis]
MVAFPSLGVLRVEDLLGHSLTRFSFIPNSGAEICNNMDEAMERSVLDQEMAIQEITRGHKLATRLHSILPTGEPLIGDLIAEVLQALSMALSILNSSNKSIQASNEQIISETSPASFSDQGSNESSDEVKSSIPTATSGCGKKGRQERSLRTMNPWAKVTYVPHDDGHQWRKYGQKNIQKSKLSSGNEVAIIYKHVSCRSYYRCSYKDEGCQATKHVQLKDSNDPHLFLVTYYEQHTCKNNNPMINSQITQDPLLQIEPNLLRFESNGNMFFNHERPMLCSSFKASTRDSELESVDLQNITIDQTARSVQRSEECLEAMPNTKIEDISSSVCMSPPWEVMNIDYLMLTGSFGHEADEGFSNF